MIGWGSGRFAEPRGSAAALDCGDDGPALRAGSKLVERAARARHDHRRPHPHPAGRWLSDLLQRHHPHLLPGAETVHRGHRDDGDQRVADSDKESQGAANVRGDWHSSCKRTPQKLCQYREMAYLTAEHAENAEKN